MTGNCSVTLCLLLNEYFIMCKSIWLKKGLFFWQENKKVLKSPTDETETTVSKDLKIFFGTQTGKAQVHQQELYLPINC